MSAPQQTAEWLSERAGHSTCSRFKDILAKVKSGEASGRRNYRVQLVTERLTGAPAESYKNAAMEYGAETEAAARQAYEELTGNIVQEVGFIKHARLPWVGGSPDGTIDSDGLIEIKCPYVSTVHVETLLAGVVPPEHLAQCQGLMWVCGRQWVDFVSFDPRMPDHLRLFVVRVQRDDSFIENLSAEVARFNREVEALTAQLMGRKA